MKLLYIIQVRLIMIRVIIKLFLRMLQYKLIVKLYTMGYKRDKIRDIALEVSIEKFGKEVISIIDKLISMTKNKLYKYLLTGIKNKMFNTSF